MVGGRGATDRCPWAASSAKGYMVYREGGARASRPSLASCARAELEDGYAALSQNS